MKKRLFILLALCALSTSALAVEWDDFRYWDAENHCWVVDVEAYHAAAALEDAQRIAAEEAASMAQNAETQPPVSSEIPTESAGDSHDRDSSGDHAAGSVDTGLDDKYPVGSYVDPAGDVWSPSGTRLSPDAVQAPLPDLETAPDAEMVEDSAPLAVIAGLLADIADDTPVRRITDLRPTEQPTLVLDGLKALVTSIFGEYTPVTTTAVVTETVGNETNQYLIETVAPGSAGVDYEWLAGVFLFGILLYCLMKLLGGVLK